MPDMPSSEMMLRAAARRRAQRPPSEPGDDDRRAALAKVISRRAGVSWWLGVVLAVGFAALVTPAITAERWPLRFHASTPDEPGTVSAKQPAPFTVRAPMFTGYDKLQVGGGVVVARGETASADEATIADAIAGAMPRGPVLYVAFFALIVVLTTTFTHHMRRSTKGRLVRVQVVSLAGLAVLAVAVKLVLLSTALSTLVVPVAVLALVPTMVLDRTVGLATGVLAALVVSLLAPFDVGLAILLLVQAATAGLVVAERPKRRWLAALGAGLVTTLCTSATYLLLTYLTTGHAPGLQDPLHSAWVAAAIGPAVAAILAVPLSPLYQLLVGEITQGKLFALEDLGHPLLRQIAEKAPGTWQHSLMMANMAEIAANEIGANGRLVRVGAYFHDLGKSISPRYFTENLEAQETSPHDQLPPEASCDAIFAHVTDGIVSARKAGLHERIVDFMHMHHGNEVLEYFWEKCRDQGNPHDFSIEDFRYPGHPPQSRETAILAICDAVEAASRTLKKPDAVAIDSLVQRIVYGKLHLGQLDESGLSMSDLRRISDSLRETIRHANHGRLEYPWQKAGPDASASGVSYPSTSRELDALDRKPGRDPAARPSIPPPVDSDAAFAATADLQDRPRVDRSRSTAQDGAPHAEGSPREQASHGDRPPGRESPSAETASWGKPAGEQHISISDGAPAGGAMPITEAVPAPPREVPITITGLAPGPLPPPPAPSTARTSGTEPPPAALTIDSEPPPAVNTPGKEPSPAARKEAAMLPPARPNRPPTAPPPLASRRATGEPARTAGPPAPVDLDNAITNPPPLRRGPSGHPPVPSDPAQLAAALTSTVSRAASAPSGMARPPEDAATRGARHADLDSAITNPPPLGSPPRTGPRHADLDSAITNPPPPGSQARTSAPRANLDQASGSSAPRPDLAPAFASEASPGAPVATTGSHSDIDAAIANLGSLESLAPRATDIIDDAITQPSISSASNPAGAPAPVAMARVPDPDGAVTAKRKPGSPPPRTTGLADDDRRPMATLRGHGGSDEAVLIRPRASISSAPPATLPGASISDAPPATRPDASISDARPPTRLSALQLEDEARVTAARAAMKLRGAGEARITDERQAALDPDLDAGVTEPSMPILAIGDERRVDLPLPHTPPASASPERKAGWASGLAARIDAALDSDEWGRETPIVAPTKAELRALLGQPDPTRQQPVDEIALLQRRAAELGDVDPPRRAPHPTTEVDPDDIEAAIEIAPHVRRPAGARAIGVAKPKKSE